VINWVNAFLVVATVAAVGRNRISFVIALLLAAPTIGFQWLGITEDSGQWLAYGWMFGAALYAVTAVYLLSYVFQPEVMTGDKLWGAAAGYLMLCVLWAYLYMVVAYFYPNSFAVFGQPAAIDFYEALYLSVTVLTSTGFGDITPFARQARGVCMVQQITGALFLAILIARLAGVYPPNRPS
jgi:Ion channel